MATIYFRKYLIVIIIEIARLQRKFKINNAVVDLPKVVGQTVFAYARKHRTVARTPEIGQGLGCILSCGQSVNQNKLRWTY